MLSKLLRCLMLRRILRACCVGKNLVAVVLRMILRHAVLVRFV